jgi:serine/threonine protein phosphatase PrpC
MSLITPLDPGASRGERVARPPVEVQECVHTTLFGRIASAVASSRGTDHGVNEDAHSALDRSTALFVVADGVGGGAMAAMASRLLVAHLHATLGTDGIDAKTVSRAMLDADRAIAQSIAQLTDAPGAATVALCAPLNVLASKWLIAWVGDCRVYRLCADSDRTLRALTIDDSFEHLHETPPPGSSADDPARMVGNGAVVRANVAFTEMGLGDMLVACSDGVHKHLEARDWSRVLSSERTLSQRCEELIGAARANGSTDDATVLVLQRSGPAVPRMSWIHRRANGNGALR